MKNKGRQGRRIYEPPKNKISGNYAQNGSGDRENVCRRFIDVKESISAFLEQKNTREKRDDDRYILKERREKLTLWWLGGYTIITALLFAVSTCQTWIARDTEIIANQAAVISTKVSFISYEEPSKPNREWDVTPLLENVGNSATRHLRHVPYYGFCVNGVLSEEYLTQKFDAMMAFKPSINAVIGPKSQISAATITGKNFSIQNCSIDVVIAGIVRYEDIFGNSHFTEYCNLVVSTRRIAEYPANSLITLDTAPCETHNCADEECGPDWRKMTIDP